MPRRRPRIEIDVVDHGPGIAAEFQNQLFRPFSRSAEQAAGKSPGIGLGLSIVHRMAKQLQGRLDWMRETPGKHAFDCPFAHSNQVDRKYDPSQSEGRINRQHAEPQ